MMTEQQRSSGMTAKQAERIEKRVTLKASPARVWKALTDHSEFAQWFGVKLHEPFVVGRPTRGTFEDLPSPEAMAEQERTMGLEPGPLVKWPPPAAVFCVPEKMESERYFSFRWVPYGIDDDVDPKGEIMTLVEFTLESVKGGTALTIVESGWENVPADRRRRAFMMNDHGWTAQVENIKRHVEGNQ
jgi:uncharacterized protein YndB with AHSA1/START domain